MIASGAWLSDFPGRGSPKRRSSAANSFRGDIRLSSLLEGVNVDGQFSFLLFSPMSVRYQSIDINRHTQKASLKHPIALPLLETSLPLRLSPTHFVTIEMLFNSVILSVSHYILNSSMTSLCEKMLHRCASQTSSSSSQRNKVASKSSFSRCFAIQRCSVVRNRRGTEMSREIEASRVAIESLRAGCCDRYESGRLNRADAAVSQPYRRRCCRLASVSPAASSSSRRSFTISLDRHARSRNANRLGLEQ